jgi:iron(III) transport system substrate-binding protein
MNVFVVNTKMLKPEQYPQKWTDLTEARFKGLVSSAPADSSGSAYM